MADEPDLIDADALFEQAIASPRFQPKLLEDYARAGRAPVIVCVNQAHLLILRNWLTSIVRTGVRDVVILALDVPTHEQLVGEGLPSILFEYPSHMKGFWIFRLRIFRYLLELGMSFVHSDADAIWLRNPYPDCFDQLPEGVDLYISQGLVHPTEVLEKWGFVLCCGLFYLRATPASLEMLRAVSAHSRKTRDDQVSLNVLLSMIPFEWEGELEEIYVYRDLMEFDIPYSKQLILGRSPRLNVALLPFRDFARLHRPGEDNPYVSHPFLAKETEPKIRELQRLGLWYL